MRILAISNLYPPVVMGGFERLCASSVERWRGQGHEVTVVTVRVPGAAAGPGVIACLPPEPGHDLPGYALMQVGWRARSRRVMAGVLETARPDLVTVWGSFGIARDAIDAVLGCGADSVAMAYDYGLLEHYAPAWHYTSAALPGRAYAAVVAAATRRAALRDDVARPARWVFCSSFVRRRVEEVLGPVAGEVVLHGVEVPGSLPPPAPPAAGLRLGGLARLVPAKGMHTLLEAARLLAAERPAAAPIVSLRGPRDDRAYFARLERLAGAARSAGARVELGAPLGDGELDPWLAAQDVVVAPAEWDEPFALLPVQAMAAGRPVVGTTLGGAAELLEDGHTALTFPPGDAAALARAIGRLRDEPGLRARIVDTAFERVATHHRAEQMDAAVDAVVFGDQL